jgi:hypothetical protein
MVSSCFVLLAYELTSQVHTLPRSVQTVNRQNERPACRAETNGRSPEMMMPHPKRYSG